MNGIKRFGFESVAWSASMVFSLLPNMDLAWCARHLGSFLSELLAMLNDNYAFPLQRKDQHWLKP